jgi:hypothetical protein
MIIYLATVIFLEAQTVDSTLFAIWFTSDICGVVSSLNVGFVERVASSTVTSQGAGCSASLLQRILSVCLSSTCYFGFFFFNMNVRFLTQSKRVINISKTFFLERPVLWFLFLIFKHVPSLGEIRNIQIS